MSDNINNDNENEIIDGNEEESSSAPVRLGDEIQEVGLKKTMESSYIDYAMSVIASRALPDVRDGLKPVQRRVLFSMLELNNTPDKPHRKCARIVGDTMGKYHPHGDSSIYGALVNLAQEWNTRYILAEGHGNFGSVDGDSPAAMRYTEARLSKISMAMLQDLNKDTVDFMPNFDGTEKEPVVLPSRFPNLLVNGTTGIAVGMATNIPPHNLGETVDAVVKIIDNHINEDRETDLSELMEIIKGPDFPTGGEIIGTRGIMDAYTTGRGKIRVRAVTDIEPMANGKNRIAITELPYNVNKSRLIENIADLVKDKKLDGITAITDETSREGMRVTIELRKDVNPQVMLNQLYKHTQLQDTFGVIMLALVNGEPKILNLKQMLDLYLDHQKEVVTRRTKFELAKAEERAHIVEGLLIALDNIDEVIRIIRSSENVTAAKEGLKARFGLSEKQAAAIVEMRLRALTGLEREKLEEEYKELQAKIAEYRLILSDEKRLLTVIRTEITGISEKYADDRRTSISFDEEDFEDEDLIPDTETVVTFTKFGYIKRMPVDTFKVQNRGGRGIKAIETIENDFVVDLFQTTTHHDVLFFTNKGRVYKLKVYKIPEASRTARGVAIVNLISLQPDEEITSMIPMKDYPEDEYLFMATYNGTAKKTKLSEYANINKNGLIAINLREDDLLIEVKKARDNDEAMLFTKFGMSVHFRLSDVRCTGRASYGVIGMNLGPDDHVIAMQLVSQGSAVMMASENGYGKCTLTGEFPLHNRGGKGVKYYKITETTGPVVGVKMVNDDDEVMIINTGGIIIRIKVHDTRLTSRIAMGVKLINLSEGQKVISIAKVRQEAIVDPDDLQDNPDLEEGSDNAQD